MITAPKETDLEKKLKEMRRRELKERGIEPRPPGPSSQEKTSTKETKLGIIKLEASKLNQFEKEIKNLTDLKNKFSKIATTEILEVLFAGTLSSRASDIHFEPEEEGVRLRLRIDGVLQDIFNLEKKDYPSVLNRIKLMAGLKINVHDAPQDGRFTLKTEKAMETRLRNGDPATHGSLSKPGPSPNDIEVRVSALPGAFGESLVMRLLDPRTIKRGLEELGLRKDLLEEIEKQLKKTTGAILTTGPTGSGKTTTLYAFVNFVNKPGVKIITIEDPIEYHIQGISQTQVKPEKGYSFANGLRSIVRQDPDAILIGEIRDSETAEIAMHAALTGHLVFSTMHTNDAAGVIPRLIDIGTKPQIIAPAINLAMAQRLVRKLCQKCKKKVRATPEELKKIKVVFKNLPQKVKEPRVTDEVKIFEAGECNQCNFTGYQDRIGIFEAFVIDEELEKLILKSPAISEVRDLAIKKGMVTLIQDAYLKILEGITDFKEVERVLGE
ncbi:MAG: GspE/PulE family protein [Patescibacteria group bacterium]